MVDISKCAILSSHVSNLKELSKDTSVPSAIQYMTESHLSAVNFDDVKTEYANSLGLSE